MNLFALLPEPPDDQPALKDVPISEQRVITNLSSGLKALNHAIASKSTRRDERKALDDAVAGASANMCAKRW